MSNENHSAIAATMTGAQAFDAVQRALAGEVVEPSTLSEPAFSRLVSALHDVQSRPSPLDLAVLTRHALRYHALQQESGEPARTYVRAGDGWPSLEQWNQVNVDAHPAAGGFWICAQPWLPTWMPNVGAGGVDGTAARAPRRRDLQATPGDPFLVGLGVEQYHSSGQRAAMRAALMTPPGATLLICLPTGEGKSLIFQAISKYGFGDGEAGIGVTLVITPTVALALDHARAALALHLPDQPRAYIGGQAHALENQLIIERIADGTQGLCFASPEAACGALRSPLMRAARAGRLRALIVDEAHLVDAWGSNFRSEFQTLSGVRHDLLGEPQGGVAAFRTVLLSATITPQAEATLRTLFGTNADGSPGPFEICAAVRLRPEIEYWAAPLCREDERRDRVREAIHHLPRPAILYTTQVKDANWWYSDLRSMGYSRIACMTGETDSFKRQAIIDGWRDGSIDLVVGTSAFGLGIDNPHVRAVIHACIPETLDRFYQEVGRGGRDGRASVSLLIPAELDRKTADGLNKQHTITIERGFQRWQAMFSHRDRVHHGGSIFTLRLDVPPGFDERDIDMVSGRNTDWNTRTLTLMATSGLITLLGEGTPTSEQLKAHGDSTTESVSGDESASANVASQTPGVYQTVRIQHPQHLNKDVWEQIVEPQRVALADANHQSLRRMFEFLRQRQCVADTLAPQYELSPHDEGQLDELLTQTPAHAVYVALACGGCGYCRAIGRGYYSSAPVVTLYPWPSFPPPHSLVDETNRLVIYYSPATHPIARTAAGSKASQRHHREALAALLRDRIHNVIVLSGTGLDLLSVQDELPRWPLFSGNHLITGQLPPGPTLVIAPPGARLTALQLAPQGQDRARVFLLPEEFEDPSRPGIPLRQSYDGREIEWNDLLRGLHL